MNVRCQCGAISFQTPSDEPKALYHCHCTQCQKQTSSAFGTSAVFTSEGIFPMDENLSEKLGVYTRSQAPKDTGEDGDGDGNDGEEQDVAQAAGVTGMVECYFCKTCGCRVLHRRRNEEGNSGGVVFIKGGLIEGLKWTGGVHIYTESAVWPIPEGAEQYEGGPPA